MDEQFKVIKFKNNTIEIDVYVSLEEHTVWLTLDQIAILYGRNKSTISKHISKILSQNDYQNRAVVAKYATTGPDGKTYVYNYYNLDVIAAIGYKINSNITHLFMGWTNNILHDENMNKNPYNSLQSSEVVKYRDGNFELDVNVSPKEDTVWLTIEQMAILFDRDRSVISRHIDNIYKENGYIRLQPENDTMEPIIIKVSIVVFIPLFNNEMEVSNLFGGT